MQNFGPMIAASARLGQAYSQRLLAGIEPVQFAKYARVGETVIESNHPAFVCGHLSLYASRIVGELGGDAAKIAPTDKYQKLFSHQAKCVDDPTGKIYPPMDELIERMSTSYQAAIEALESAEDDLFVAENPNEGMRAKFPTIGAMHAFYVGGHFMVHMGQLSAWRRAIGLGPA